MLAQCESLRIILVFVSVIGSGTTQSVTNDTTTTALPRVTNGPSVTQAPVPDRLRVCYYSNWSQYRSGTGAFTPADIDPFLCTHLIYSFAKLNSSFQIEQNEPNDEQLYATFNSLKSTNSNLKTLLALGGPSSNNSYFSDMVLYTATRQNFAVAAVDYLRHYGFDGLDVDWQYPNQHGGGRPEDKDNFVLLLQDIRAAFDNEGNSTGNSTLLLTAAVTTNKDIIDVSYNISGIQQPLDFINLMAYDFHGSWESQVGHNSPLSASFYDSDPTLNVEWAAQYWNSQGVPKEKLVIGLATYGRSFTLTDAANHTIGDSAAGAGTAGPYTGEAGFLAYYEVCAILDQSSVDQYWEPDSKVPYLVSGNQWIGYEDERSFNEKLLWILDEKYGGAMVWNIDLDDFRGNCSSSTRPYPLLSLMTDVLVDSTSTSTTVTPTAASNTTTPSANVTSSATSIPTYSITPSMSTASSIPTYSITPSMSTGLSTTSLTITLTTAPSSTVMLPTTSVSPTTLATSTSSAALTTAAILSGSTVLTTTALSPTTTTVLSTTTPLISTTTIASTAMSTSTSSIAPTASVFSTASATASSIAASVTTPTTTATTTAETATVATTTASNANCQPGSGICIMAAQGLGSSATSVRPFVLTLMLSMLLPLTWILET